MRRRWRRVWWIRGLDSRRVTWTRSGFYLAGKRGQPTARCSAGASREAVVAVECEKDVDGHHHDYARSNVSLGIPGSYGGEYSFKTPRGDNPDPAGGDQQGKVRTGCGTEGRSGVRAFVSLGEVPDHGTTVLACNPVGLAVLGVLSGIGGAGTPGDAQRTLSFTDPLLVFVAAVAGVLLVLGIQAARPSRAGAWVWPRWRHPCKPPPAGRARQHGRMLLLRGWYRCGRVSCRDPPAGSPVHFGDDSQRGPGIVGRSACGPRALSAGLEA